MSQTNTPYARLTQALAEHRFALTGYDLKAQRAALEVVQALVQAELQQVRMRARVQREGGA